MSTILIVDDDLGLQKILGLSLQKYKDVFEVIFASNGEEAVTILKQQTIDLLVTDIKMPKMDGLALLSHMSVTYSTTPCIVLTSYTIPGLEQKLSSAIFHFLKKPVEPAALARLIVEGLDQAEKNEASSGVSVPGLMQVIEAEEKTCFLVIHAKGKRQGGMYFHNGVLYDAVCGDKQGESAALCLIGLDNAKMEYRKLPPKKIPQAIQSGVQSLILEAMRIKDEKIAAETDGKGDKSLQHEDLLTKGIRLCKGLHFKEAQKPLLQVVAQDADNVLAWLWLSRTVTNMKQLRVALTKAYKLDPKSMEAMHDIRMFSTAGKMGLEQVRRCPFCYAPIALKAGDCHFCRASLAVTEEVLPKIGKKANQTELRAALKRFEEVLTTEINIPVLFYAGLACLYLDDFDASLQYLEQVQQFAVSGEDAYRTAVGRILEFIASRQTTEEVRQTTEEVENGPKIKIQDLFAEEQSDQKKILVVEDSPTTRKVIKMTLQSKNFNVIEAEDGIEALTKINDEQPDLILLDVMLPKLDGYGILSVLKKNSQLKGVPVIMLTSKDGLKDRIKGRFSSASAYLTKPFKPEVLIKKVNQYLQ